MHFRRTILSHHGLQLDSRQRWGWGQDRIRAVQAWPGRGPRPGLHHLRGPPIRHGASRGDDFDRRCGHCRLSGWYNIASSGADGVLVHVSASDPSDVTNITCTDYSTEVANTSSNPTSFTLGDLTHSISCQATDGASPSNTGAGSGSTPMPVSLLIDQTAPSGVVANPSRGADKNGWYNAPFDVTWSGSDATSGISSCTQTSYSGPDVDSGSLSGSCTDVAGNTNSSVPFPFKFDNTDPTVSLSVPANGADYLKDQ